MITDYAFLPFYNGRMIDAESLQLFCNKPLIIANKNFVKIIVSFLSMINN